CPCCHGHIDSGSYFSVFDVQKIKKTGPHRGSKDQRIMTRPTLKQIILILAAVLVIAAIIYGFLPEAETVETERIVSGILQVIVEEEGQTEVEEKFIISSPVAANIRRVDLEPGDWVEEGTELVRLAPPPSGMLDARS